MKKITRFINSHDMLKPGDAVVVGLSGGADSVLLTYVLYQYGAKVTAVHINHMLRGEESLRDEAFVKQFCAQYDIPCLVYREDIAARARKEGCSEETAGRAYRYRVFLSEAKKRNARVATAHTLSDQTETMLFRLARGSGLEGLCGILPVREQDGVILIRPLLELSRDEVEQACAAYRLSYVTDSSNASDMYARNRIRHHVIPVLKEINTRTQEHFGQTAKLLCADMDYMKQEAQKAYALCQTQNALSAQELLKLHPAIQSRVFVLFLQEKGITADALMLKRITDLLQKQMLPQSDQRYGSVSLPKGKVLLLRGERLYLSDGKSNAPVFPEGISKALMMGETVRYRMPSGRCWIFSQSDTKPIQKIHKNLFFFCLDYDKIKGVPICRGRIPADRITIYPRGVTKTVKKWMNEENIPIDERESRFLLADDAGVFFAEGLGIAQRVAVDDSTRHFLIIKTADETDL